MSAPLPLRFVVSADKASRLPDRRAEVAFIGRSNVGKSSLINALARRHALANVSKTPGRTRVLNLFDLEGTADAVVDCPGFGYAKASKSDRAAWHAMVEQYLLERESLRMTLVLVDGEIGPTPLDQEMLAWLRANVVSHTVIATKHDKVKATKREKRKRELAAGCNLEPRDVVWVSAEKGTGIDRLRELVRLWLS